MLRGASGLEFQACTVYAHLLTWLACMKFGEPSHTPIIQYSASKELPHLPPAYLPYSSSPSCLHMPKRNAVVARCVTIADCPVESPRLSTVPHCLTTPRVPKHHRKSQASSSFSTLVDGPIQERCSNSAVHGCLRFSVSARILPNALYSEAERPDVNQVGTNTLDSLVIRAQRCGDDRPQPTKQFIFF